MTQTSPGPNEPAQTSPKRACAYCDKDFSPAASTGRPQLYCGRGCRRMAEYEIRRLQRRILNFELQLDELTIAPTEWNRKTIQSLNDQRIALLERLRALADPAADHDS